MLRGVSYCDRMSTMLVPVYHAVRCHIADVWELHSVSHLTQLVYPSAGQYISSGLKS